ncbi:MAG: hypothetical protein ACYC4P_18705 [Thermoanaerobaculia bacterium]
MSTEYRHFLVPTPRSWRPSPAALAAFIQLLTEEHLLPSARGSHFVSGDDENADYDDPSLPVALLNTPSGLNLAVPFPVTTDWLANVMATDFRLSWPVDEPQALNVLYPFVPTAPELEAPSFRFTVHSGLDYVYVQGPNVGPLRRFPFRSPRCVCGIELEYRSNVRYVLDGPRLRAVCPSCRTEFHPERYSSRITDDWTGATRKVPGGLVYRFAVVLECEKALPSRPGRSPTLRQPLSQAWQQSLGCGFEEVPYFY